MKLLSIRIIQYFVLTSLVFSGIVAFANEPYVPSFPMIIGENSEMLVNSELSYEGDVPQQNESNLQPITVQKILTSNEIGKTVDVGYGIFEKIRVHLLKKIEEQKASMGTVTTNFDGQKSPGVNAERGHDALLLFTLSSGVFIFSHPLIAYILLVLLALAVARAFF